MSNRRHFINVTVLVILVTGIAYFVLRAIYQLPPAASNEAIPIDQLFQGHFFMIAFLFSLIMVLMLYSAYAFRRQPGDESDGTYFHGHTGLEIGWTIVPLVAVIGFSVWSAQILGEITRAKDQEMVVQVIAQKWSWAFVYPELEGVGPTRELVLPLDQTVRLEMSAPQGDVIHAFWVPEFRVKQDILPGRVTILRITPTVAGEYTLMCAELCGYGHADMHTVVRVVSSAEFNAWIQDQSLSLAEMAPEERGEKWAGEFGCLACHSTDGTPRIGPTWDDLYGRERPLLDGTTAVADDPYLHEAIVDPNAKIVAGFAPNVMPLDFAQRFAAREAEIQEREGVAIDIAEDLIRYIQSLGQ
jgi:cytochrome c oxidase subunit II